MELHHPVFQEMLQLGCHDRMKVTSSFNAYMKLCEVDKLWDVQFLYDKQLDLIYLSSKDKKEGLVLHVPATFQQPISPAWLHTISSTLRLSHPQAAVNILLKTPDTTLLQYKLTEGLCPPPTPEATKEKKALQEKRQYVEAELHKHKAELFEEAKKRKTLEKVADSGKSNIVTSDEVINKDNLVESDEDFKDEL